MKLILNAPQLRGFIQWNVTSRCFSKKASSTSFSCRNETEQMSQHASFSPRAVVHQGKNMSKAADSREDRRVGVYSSSGHVDLNSVTQSSVPKPYKTVDNKNSSSAQKNVMGRDNSQGTKLVSNKVSVNHPKRNFGTAVTPNGASVGKLLLPNACSAFAFSPLVCTDPSLKTLQIRCMSSDSIAKVSQKERLKKAVKEYGSTVIVFHVSISLVSLGCFYLGVSSGLDMAKMLSMIGVSASVVENNLATGASTFVVAYAVHKVFAPVRIGITLTATPLIVRHLRKIGFLASRATK